MATFDLEHDGSHAPLFVSDCSAARDYGGAASSMDVKAYAAQPSASRLPRPSVCRPLPLVHASRSRGAETALSTHAAVEHSWQAGGD